MYGHRLIEQAKLVQAVEWKNWTGAAATGDYVSLKGYDHCTIVIVVGAFAGGTAAVTINQATTVAAAGAKALGFTEMWWNTDTTATDTLVRTAVVANTFNLAAANEHFVIEVPAASLDLAGNFDCLSLAIASPGANADYYGAVYLLWRSRYAQALPPSAIVD